MQQPTGWETSNAYPLVTYTDGLTVKQFGDFETNSNSTVRIIRLDEEKLIPTLAEHLREGGVVGIVVNTVRRAQEIAKLCSFHFGEALVDLLHSTIAPIGSRGKTSCYGQLAKTPIDPREENRCRNAGVRAISGHRLRSSYL